MTGILALWFDRVVSQQEPHPTTDTTQGPLSPAAKVHLRFEKFSAFIEEYRPKISLGGMFLETTEPKPVGSTVACDFELTDGFRLCQALGEVVWVRRQAAGPDQPAGMGIRFQAIDDKGRELVLKIIDEQKEAGGQPFEVERIPPGAETVPVGGSPAPREDPASTMSRKAVAPGEDPASTHSQPAVPTGPRRPATPTLSELEPLDSLELEGDSLGSPVEVAPPVAESPSAEAPGPAPGPSDMSAEVIAVEEDGGFTLESSEALKIEPMEAPLAVIEAAPVDVVSVEDGPEPASFDATPSPSPSEAAPAPSFGATAEEEPDFGFGAPDIGAVDFPTSFDTPDSTESDRAFQPTAAPGSGEISPSGEAGEEPPETLVLPPLKEEDTGPGSAWSLEPDSDDTNPSGLDLLAAPASDPTPQSTSEEPVGMDSELFGDDLPENTVSGDELPDDESGGDALPSPRFDESPAEPAPSVFGSESEHSPDDAWDEEDDEWDDEEETSRMGLFKIALMESKGRILGLLLIIVLAVGGLLYKDQLLDLVGLGSSPMGAPQNAETIVAQPLPAPAEPEIQEPPPPAAETPADLSPPTPAPPPEPEPVQASDLRPAASGLRPTSASSSPATKVEELTFEQTAEGTRILVRFDGYMPQGRFEHNPLSYDLLKEQVVLLGIRLPYHSRIDVGTLELDRIRTGLHGDQLKLVFDLSSEVMTVGEIRPRGDQLEILVRRR